MPSSTATTVLELLRQGTYDGPAGNVSIAVQQHRAEQCSRLHTPGSLASVASTLSRGSPRIEVWDASTQTAARELAADGPLALLNFASARNPGGGFLNGANAQEEDLCRCSGLYPTLTPHQAYYDANRRQKSMLYTDHAITSPGVPFFKVRGRGPLLAQPFLADVITMPAPNSAPHLARNPGDLTGLTATFLRRWTHVLALAHLLDRRTLLLGAWGCGAFGGDAEMASTTARQAIATSGSAVDRVVFAIPDRGRRGRRNHAVFAATFRSAT